MKGQPIKLIAAVVLFGVAGGIFAWQFLSGEPSAEDLPQGTFWICRNCKAEFNIPLSEMKAKMDTSYRVPCIECEKFTTVRALGACPHCGRYYEQVGHGFIPEQCEHCQKSLH